jgi:hypothetical protein
MLGTKLCVLCYLCDKVDFIPILDRKTEAVRSNLPSCLCFFTLSHGFLEFETHYSISTVCSHLSFSFSADRKLGPC